MKLTIVLWVAAFLQVNAATFAQKISLNVKDVSLEEALVLIGRQTNHNFIYNTKMLKAGNAVSITATNKSLSEVLDECFKNQPLTYVINGNTVVIRKKEIPVKLSTIDVASISVTGVVSDPKGEPLVGVTVKVKGTSIGVVTNNDGRYSINTPEGNSVLVFSYLGFATQEIALDNRTQLNVTLKESTSTLNEVVVIGYGTRSQKDVVTAVSTVKGQSIQNLPVTSPVALLQGRSSGVQIVQNSGAPGGTNFSIRVRGTTSINAGNNPLYVVDGIPFEGNTSDINPNDIQSIDILKDAAAASIYGSRAANGVVLITTKRGKTGKAAITFNAYQSFQSVNKERLPEMLNASEFIELIQEQRANSTLGSVYASIIMPDNGLISNTNGRVANTNWLDNIMQTGHLNNYDISLRGGTEKLSFYFSGSYLTQKGILINSDFKRYTTKLNLDYHASSKFKIGTSLNLNQGITNSSTNDGFFGIVQQALVKPPVMPIFATDGSYYVQDPSGTANVVAVAALETRNTRRNRFLGNVFGEYSIIPDLVFKTSWSADIGFRRFDFFTPTTARNNTPASAQGEYSDDVNWVHEQTLAYNKELGKHRLSGLLGYSQALNRFNSLAAGGNGFASNIVETLNSAPVPVALSPTDFNFNSNYGLSSLFGRIGYVLNDKYYFEASTRRDGSSKFGKNHTYAWFPGVSVGWQVGREAFFERYSNTISDLKLKASWGRTGNQGGIGNYISQGLYGTGQNYLGVSGIGISTIPNPDLKWETTDAYNAGVDVGFLKGRITFGFNTYIKKTSDLLLGKQLPTTTGFTNALVNVGSTQNKGVEFDLNTINFAKKDFNWSTNFNISFNKNKILKLDEGGNDIINTRGEAGFGRAQTFNLLREGESIGVFYGFQSNGVYQYSADNVNKVRADGPTGYQYKGGDMIFTDLDGNNIIDNADRMVIGNALPQFTGGLTNTLRYKNFDLDMLAQFSYGNDVYNGVRTINESMSQFSNATKSVLNRWRNEGDVSSIPRADHLDPGVNKRASTRFLEDGSYLRLKTLTLGYRIPAKLLTKVKIDNVRLYATGQNLLTLTKYTGIDPEANTGDPNRATDLGFDYAVYPQYRTFLFGINVGF
ncbi:MAG: TonB-dependent receptor [Pyrinomonadaceae bacterium]|nr:TonB-dependent receptor [Sphingobacteriaceae bacterium]